MTFRNIIVNCLKMEPLLEEAVAWVVSLGEFPLEK
jgi:hypothetical protein